MLQAKPLPSDTQCAFQDMRKHSTRSLCRRCEKLLRTCTEWQSAQYRKEINSPRRKRQLYFRNGSEVWKDGASSCLRSCFSEKVQFNPSWHNTLRKKKIAGASRVVLTEKGRSWLSIQPSRVLTSPAQRAHSSLTKASAESCRVPEWGYRLLPCLSAGVHKTLLFLGEPQQNKEMDFKVQLALSPIPL